jgi:hypothetical protein
MFAISDLSAFPDVRGRLAGKEFQKRRTTEGGRKAEKREGIPFFLCFPPLLREPPLIDFFFEALIQQRHRSLAGAPFARPQVLFTVFAV